MDKIGTLYVTADGTAYRLRSYSTDMNAKPFTGEATVPDYAVHYVSGSSSFTRDLPDDADVVFTGMGE